MGGRSIEQAFGFAFGSVTPSSSCSAETEMSSLSGDGCRVLDFELIYCSSHQ